MDNIKQANFKRIAESRTNKIIKMIRLLGNLSNTAHYEYSRNQIKMIFSTIQNELDEQRIKFETQQKKNKSFKL